MFYTRVISEQFTKILVIGGSGDIGLPNSEALDLASTGKSCLIPNFYYYEDFFNLGFQTG